MKPLIFSRYFPSYHPKSGQLTYFVEEIRNGLGLETTPLQLGKMNPNKIDIVKSIWSSIDPMILHTKITTIRMGRRWKHGEIVSPRVWSGRPYVTPQLTFSPPLRLSVEDIEVGIYVDTISYPPMLIYGITDPLDEIARKDGFLNTKDFTDWFLCNPKFMGYAEAQRLTFELA